MNKKGYWSKPSSDGGFGVMQLTSPKPTYEEIWNYRSNIDGAANLIKREKLPTAKAYPGIVRTKGCSEQSYPDPKTGKIVTPPKCRPMPETEKDLDAEDFDAYELRMDVYSLYNSNWHYWKWDKTKEEWKGYKSNKGSQKRSSAYAKILREIETNPQNDCYK